jgi:2-keto-3-deoxy-L-rhamnonate aldolase RhmA
MPAFLFSATLPDGEKVRERIDAASLAQARYILEVRKYTDVEFFTHDNAEDIARMTLSGTDINLDDYPELSAADEIEGQMRRGLTKPVLDIGADGVIVPLVRTADDVRRAVAACRYPPDGLRGFGPRRASGYGRLSGPDYCRLANETVICVVQIEHIDAVNNLDEILAVPGLTSIVLGPNDLAGSMGHMGQPTHPEVLAAMEHVVAKTRQTNVWASVSVGGGPDDFAGWVRRGVQWIGISGDIAYMLLAARMLTDQTRARLAA